LEVFAKHGLLLSLALHVTQHLHLHVGLELLLLASDTKNLFKSAIENIKAMSKLPILPSFQLTKSIIIQLRN
jgi:hypothetical protein